MPGMLDWKIKISADIKDLQNKMHKVEGELGEFEGKDHKVKLDLDTKTLESALKKLDSMLDSLGKGTGDFKQFETLSKDLAKVTSELSGFTKAFGKIDNSGTKSLLDMVQNIDKSLNNLSNHVTDVAKNLGNIGKDSGASSAVAQIENITKANEEAIKSTEKLAETRKKINDNVSVSTKGTSFTSNTSALQQEEKQIQKNINSLNKLLALKSDVKNVKKSSYSGKGNLDYVGIYHSQEEAVSKDLATKSNKLNASLNLILNEDKDAVQELESEVTKLKTSLQSVQDLTKRISKNSSINDLTKEQDVTERLKGYASAYQAIDTRLGELNNEYSLSNKQLEEYITLQAKAEKIMNEVASNEFGGVRGYGDVTSKAQLKMLVEESFAKRLGYDSQDVYDGLFKNISDANYDSKHISLFGDNGKKRSLKEVSAQILDYKSSASSLSGVFGANEDIERLNTLNSILNYIKNNEKEIANTDFTAQINRLTAMLENTSGLTFLEEELQELKSYQERLDSVKNTSINSSSTSSSISEQNKVQEELKETQTQAEKTKEALNESNISSEVSAFQQQEKIQNQVTQSIQEQNKAIDESIKKTLTLNDVRQKQWEIIQKTNPKEEGTNSTWVDKPEDAKTFYEVNHKDSDYPFNENYSDDWTVKDKMNVEATGKITVYSSYPIEDGNWVTPSKEEGLSYAGSGKLYSATMDPRDIAWVDAGQGQVAHISDELKEVIDLSTKAETQVQSIDNNTNETCEQSTLNALDDTIAKYETIVSLVKEYYDLSNNKKDTIGISSDDERISEIRKQLKSYTKNPDYNGEYKMGFGGSGKNIFAKSVDLSQEEMLQEICNMLGVEIPKNADKAKEAIKEVASATATTEPKKDAFSDSSNNTKPETEGMEQVEKATEEAVQAKKDFATANEGVQSSIDDSENPLKLEAELMEQIAKSAREAANAKKEFVEANKQVKDSAEKTSVALKSVKSNIKEVTDESEKLTNAQKEQNVNVNLNKYDKRLDSYNGKVDKYQATIDRFNDGGWTSDTYLKNVQAVRDAIKQYATLLDNIKTNQNGIASDEDIQNLDKYEKKIKDTIATVTNMSAAEKGYNFVSGQKELDKIHKLLVENSKMSSEAKAKIKAYYAEIESGNPSMSLDKIHGEILKIYNAEVEAGRAGKSMWSAIKEKAWYGAASAIGTYFGVNDIFRYGKEIADTVIQLDTATTELRKVSDATDQRLVTNFKNSANTAKQLGSTISDVISATADWSRMGYDIDQAEELARVSTLYKNVGDGIDIETANNSLISTLQGFQLDASQAESIIDKFNEVANNYAIDSAGIGEALQRSAASFNAANTDLSKSIALITATNEVVQDPDSVGTLWKTMSARIRGAETELSELNEETDEYTKTTSKLRDLIKSLTGFDIMADEDTFKDIYDIILGIGKEWNNLTDAEQSSLGEALAGKRNANALYAVLGNLDTLQSAYKTAENSAGSAQREQENYQKSIQYSIDQTKAKLEELSADFLSSDFLKGAIDAGGKLIDILDNIVKSGNAIPAVATAIAAAFSFKNVGLDKNVLNSRPHTISYMV